MGVRLNGTFQVLEGQLVVVATREPTEFREGTSVVCSWAIHACSPTPIPGKLQEGIAVARLLIELLRHGYSLSKAGTGHKHTTNRGYSQVDTIIYPELAEGEPISWPKH
jgi:hypothetical protein